MLVLIHLLSSAISRGGGLSNDNNVCRAITMSSNKLPDEDGSSAKAKANTTNISGGGVINKQQTAAPVKFEVGGGRRSPNRRRAKSGHYSPIGHGTRLEIRSPAKDEFMTRRRAIGKQGDKTTTSTSSSDPKLVVEPAPNNGSVMVSAEAAAADSTDEKKEEQEQVGQLPRTLSTSVLRIKHRRSFWEKVVG